MWKVSSVSGVLNEEASRCYEEDAGQYGSRIVVPTSILFLWKVALWLCNVFDHELE